MSNSYFPGPGRLFHYNSAPYIPKLFDYVIYVGNSSEIDHETNPMIWFFSLSNNWENDNRRTWFVHDCIMRRILDAQSFRSILPSKYFVIFFRMIRLHESGIIAYLKRKYFGFLEETQCSPDFQVGTSKLSLWDVWPPFAVAAVGLGLATVAIVTELLHVKARHRTRASKRTAEKEQDKWPLLHCSEHILRRIEYFEWPGKCLSMSAFFSVSI